MPSDTDRGGESERSVRASGASERGNSAIFHRFEEKRARTPWTEQKAEEAGGKKGAALHVATI